MSAALEPKMHPVIASRQTFVFSKANALAKRISVEKDKKHAAHVVCAGLLAMLRLCRNDGRTA
jgi:hypothetical protein